MNIISPMTRPEELTVPFLGALLFPVVSGPLSVSSTVEDFRDSA